MQRRRAAAVAAERKLWLDRSSDRGFEGGGWNFGLRNGGGRSCGVLLGYDLERVGEVWHTSCDSG